VGAVFLLAAAVQYNDPDGLAWMVLYATAAAVAVGLAGRGRLPGGAAAPALVATVALVWAATLVFVGDRDLATPANLFGGWEMADASIEKSREVGGLVIVAAWMTFLAVVHARRRRRGAPAVQDERR
jgi:hypothetical protein